MERKINSLWDFSEDNIYWTKTGLDTDYNACKWRKWGHSKWSGKSNVGIYKREDDFTDLELNHKYIYMFITGVSEACEVYVNDKLVYKVSNESDLEESFNDKWLMPFYFNIKPYVKKSNNEIKVKIRDRKGKGIFFAPVKYVFSDHEMELEDFYKSIEELNPNFYDLMNQGLKKNNAIFHDYLNGLRPLSLFWFSDVHSDGLIFNRLMKFYNDNNALFDDAINTGDMCDISFMSDFTYYDVKGCEKVLLTIGNHENLKTHINYDWKTHNPTDSKDEYNKFFAPYIKNWGVNYIENKTYYYKDYSDKNIRLFVLDLCLFGEDYKEQLDWFNIGLNEALNKKYSVIVATHVLPITGEFVKINCPYTNLDSTPKIDLFSKSIDELKLCQDAIDYFINKGGEFICWIGGHYHCDYIGYVKDYPKQLQIFIDSANRGHSENFCDLSRVDGEKSMDLTNCIIFDQEDKLIKIIRIGASIDRQFRDRTTTCINYKDFKIIK